MRRKTANRKGKEKKCVLRRLGRSWGGEGGNPEVVREAWGFGLRHNMDPKNSGNKKRGTGFGVPFDRRQDGGGRRTAPVSPGALYGKGERGDS